MKSLTRLQVHPHTTASAVPIGAVRISLLELSMPAAAVFAGILRSAQASKAAGSLVLSHLNVFRPGDAGEISTGKKCRHVFGVLQRNDCLDHTYESRW